MILTAYPGNSLHGEIHLPGDKSLSHRAALFASLEQLVPEYRRDAHVVLAHSEAAARAELPVDDARGTS